MRLRDRLVRAFLGLLLTPAVIFLGQKNVDILHPGFDRGRGSPLQGGIKRGVNAKIFAQQVAFGVFVEQVVLDHVDEVGGFAAGDGGFDDVQRGLFGLLNIFLVDVFVLQHLREHAVARLRAALWVTVGGGIIVGRANDAG